MRADEQTTMSPTDLPPTEPPPDGPSPTDPSPDGPSPADRVTGRQTSASQTTAAAPRRWDGTDVERSPDVQWAWVADAVRRVEADANRSADTHLHRFALPAEWGIDVYLKDESVHPTGSLKHRLARSLVIYGLVNGWIGPTTTLVEASSGSTAVSEAYFAQLLGLPFVTVVPRSTSAEKIALIERYGGRCHFVDRAGDIYDVARQVAAGCDGHYLDQFTNAERATDWRGNNNIAESIFEQMAMERHPVPRWIVVGAGTGGTSATIGRYIRYRCLDTRLAVVDPEHSAFFPAWEQMESSASTAGSRIEGIGRPRVEPSFLPTLVDRMICVPDAASVAAARFAHEVTGRLVGASTGTNLWGVLRIVEGMLRRGEQGSIVTLICDGGERYLDTYLDDAWVAAQGWELAAYTTAMREFVRSGRWPDAGE